MGVALLAPLASHRTATQCLFIIEVIKLSGYVHSVENQDSHAKMHGCQRLMCAASEFACYMYAFVGVLSMVYAFMVLQVALLASLASHRMATQCMSVIEVIKLSG